MQDLDRLISELAEKQKDYNAAQATKIASVAAETAAYEELRSAHEAVQKELTRVVTERVKHNA